MISTDIENKCSNAQCNCNTKICGILQPAGKNKFRLSGCSLFTKDELFPLVNQFLSMKFKYNKSITEKWDSFKIQHELELIFEEPMACVVFSNSLEKLVNHEDFEILIDNLDSNDMTTKTTIYRGCSVITYRYDLDYAKSESCKYVLSLLVNNVERK